VVVSLPTGLRRAVDVVARPAIVDDDLTTFARPQRSDAS